MLSHKMVYPVTTLFFKLDHSNGYTIMIDGSTVGNAVTLLYGFIAGNTETSIDKRLN